MNNQVVVIRGDVIGSRKIKNKESFWEQIDEVISRVNEEFREEFLFQFEIFNGDELMGVCRNSKKAYEVSAKIIEYLHPHKIRIVISEGNLDKKRKTKKLSELDGEVFWNASREINALKKTKGQFSFVSGDKKKDSIITSLGDLLALLKYEWTHRETEIIQLYDKIKNQQEVAKRLKISQQSVSDGLIRSKHKRIRESEKVLIEFL